MDDPIAVADGSRNFQRAGAPDLEHVTALYRAHHPFVWRVLRRCGVPEPDLDDAVQETFLVVVRRLGDFDGRAAITTWLYAVAVRVASTLRRSHRREDVRRQVAGRGMHADTMLDPEVELSRAEAARVLDGLLEELDESKRTVFVLADLEGVRVPEISRILGVNVRTVHSRLRLARERFGVALHRHHARTDGRVMRARQAARRLAAATADERPPTARRKAAHAALLADLGRGAMPSLPGWQSLAVVAPSSFMLPLVATLAIGGAGLGVAATAIDRPASSRDGDVARVLAAGGREPALDVPTSHVLDPAIESEAQAPGTESRAPTRVTSGQASPTMPHARAEKTLPKATHDDDASALSAETALVRTARDALRAGDPRAALRTLEVHAERFPRGTLVDEARSSRLRALCDAGEPSKAKALADDWSAGDAGSRWHDVVRVACRDH